MNKKLKLTCMLVLTSMHVISQQPFDLDQSFRLNAQDQYMNDVLPLENNSILITGRFKFPGDEYYRTGSLVDTEGNVLEEWPIGGRIKRWGSFFYGSSGGNSVVRLFEDGYLDGEFWNNITVFTGPQGVIFMFTMMDAF